MTEFFTSGRAVDVVLLVLLIEAIWLKQRGQGWQIILGALIPAALMLLALRAALTGGHWMAVALPLTLAFPVHLYDLYRRDMLQRKTRP